MRKSIFFFSPFLLLFSFPCLFAQQGACKSFTLQGTTQWPNGTTIYLQYAATLTKFVTDSCKVVNQSFYFKGCIAEPVMASCSIGPVMNAIASNEYCDIFLSPATMHLTLPKNNVYYNAHLTGSEEDSIFNAYRRIEARYKALLKPLRDSILFYQQIIQKAAHENNTSLIAVYRSLLQQLQERVHLFNRSEKTDDSLFILQHPFSYFILSWLASAKNDWMPLATIEKMYASFPDDLKKSKNGKMIAQYIANEKKFAVGNTVPDFTITDVKGNTIHLAAYKQQQYVLLEFGASYCLPCRQIEPYLKNIDSLYRNHLAIISISTEESAADWHRWVEHANLPWIQIFDQPVIKKDGGQLQKIGDAYQIVTIPSMLLLDKQGCIVAKYGGYYTSPIAYIPALKQQLHAIFEY
ncbi:MAG: redoxin domain-containing protein [Hydrotalea flava]|uniref:TlpA disulfide reductase family protein n=1 Tax=Hydrotalea TaxID=1004300 RepID=UPI0009430A99|nr:MULTISPECIES: TlpA disulfide reductase family protein [Hydrotalea]NIM36571.1 redoxin domain-containing protein [Hydrotalea flava]NIM39431.1 redoxin domain-containing protein [Hydrotalea flava]NIN04620.1 redoxin domain-containing protein [Hydrotalea flava]NIN16292.1 redoxin domain-containing protein [Hydrotalea flava]NIO95357.1 redoxin domain-containing protein [Hydrotalea flava]